MLLLSQASLATVLLASIAGGDSLLDGVLLTYDIWVTLTQH